MKVLLIYPPTQLLDSEVARPDGSLGLLYLAAALERAGLQTDILDANVGPPGTDLNTTFYRMSRLPNGLTKIGMTEFEIQDYIAAGRYEVVGISSMFTPQMAMVIQTAQAAKRAADRIRVILGGVNARAMWQTFLKTELFEGVCLTEGETTIVEAVQSDVLEADGWAWQNHLGFFRNAVTSHSFVSDLDDLPMPTWDKLPLELYDQIGARHGQDVTGEPYARDAPIATSRGCRWRCRYCHISNEKENIGNLRFHSIGRVVREIEYLKSLGVKRLYLKDDSFAADKPRAAEILGHIADMEMTILGTNGINLRDLFLADGEIDKAFLTLCVSAGVKQLVFPVESGSQRILDKYATGKVQLDRMALVALMMAMTHMGITAPVNMMVGFPDETEAEIQQTIDLGKRLREAGAPYVSFMYVVPFPGSQLFDTAIQNGYLSLDFDPSTLNWKQPVMENTTVSAARLAELQNQANEEVNDPEFVRMMEEKTIGYKWNHA